MCIAQDIVIPSVSELQVDYKNSEVYNQVHIACAEPFATPVYNYCMFYCCSVVYDIVVAYSAVSYTHLTLPTKRIV